MKKATIKYHQPSLQQLQSQKMNYVFDMLKKQQDGISQLLKKYQNTAQQDIQEYFSHRKNLKKLKNKSQSNEKLKNKNQSTIDVIDGHSKSKSLKNNKSKKNSFVWDNSLQVSSNYKAQHKILLPQIRNLKSLKSHSSTPYSKLSEQLNESKQKINKNKKNSQTIQYSNIDRQNQKTSLREQLEKLYYQNKKKRDKQSLYEIDQKRSKKNNTKRNNSRMSSDYSRISIINNSNLQNNYPNQNISKNKNKISSTSPHLTNIQNEIPTPMGISIPLNSTIIKSTQHIAQPNSDSQQQENIPLSYYQRQFKSLMTSQCVQQINYLYFSKNESIKDWSQSLLGMFQKHDKQILTLRKKMKYLQKFDGHFFAVDIYKN